MRSVPLVLSLAAAAAACSAPASPDVSSAESSVNSKAPLTGFSGWTEIPGGGTTSTPDAVVSYNGKLYVFAIGTGDHAHYVNTFDGVKWTGWSAVPGGGTTLVADTAVAFGGKLYLFGIGIGDHGHYVNTFDGARWSGWSQVPGGGTTLVSDGAAVFDGKLYLFGIGGNDHAHYVKTFDGATWSGWSQVPGGGTTLLPDAAVAYNGRLYVFGLGIGDHGHYVNSFDGVTWSGWSAVPGGLQSVVPDAATVYGGRLYLFGVNASDGSQQVNVFDGSSWTGWQANPAVLQTKVADAAAVYKGTAYVVSVGTNGKHYVQTMSNHAALPKYNQVSFTGTHNSYWVKRDNVDELYASGTQERLVDQAVFEGVRAMEIDLHRDDTTPHNFTVYHTDKPSNSFCPQLSDCLKELLDFHHALPDHDPFTIVLELKETTTEQFFDSSSHTPADLDAIVESYLGPYLFRPRDLMATCAGSASVRDCVAKAGWPRVDQLRGRFLVTVIGNYNAEAGDVANACVPVIAHNRKAWVDYGGSDPTRRTAFLMESPWATPKIACQEGIPQSAVDWAVANAPFVQYEGGTDGFQFPQTQGWLSQNLAIRADIGGNNQPSLAEQQLAANVHMAIIQNDHPWFSISQAPLRPGTATGVYDDLNEPGHRVLLKQLKPNVSAKLPLLYNGRPSIHWETTVAETRPTTDGASPNPRRPRGTGCLYASTASDANGNFQNGVRICRTTADGHWNVSKPLGEDAVIKVDFVQNGSTSTNTYYSDDRDAAGNGEMLRLDVNQTATTNACVTVYSSEQTANDMPAWRALETHCFGTTLGESGLAARDGDVLFAGTKNSKSWGPRAPMFATEDIDFADGIGPSYAVVDLTWPRVHPGPACQQDQAGGCAIPVHRSYGSGAGHFYSTDIREASSWGFDVEVPSYFYVETASGPNRAPLNRCYNPDQNRRFYTQDPACEGYGHKESTLGYVGTTQLPGTIPLYRMYSAAQNDHFYTTDWNEVNSAKNVGYVYERVAGYVWPSWGLVYNGPPIQ